MITDCIPHEEAVIQHFIQDPELTLIMLQDAIDEGDIHEARKIQQRINEANSHRYRAALLSNAEQTAKDGSKLESITTLVSKALGILKAAVPAGA